MYAKLYNNRCIRLFSTTIMNENVFIYKFNHFIIIEHELIILDIIYNLYILLLINSVDY